MQRDDGSVGAAGAEPWRAGGVGPEVLVLGKTRCTGGVPASVAEIGGMGGGAGLSVSSGRDGALRLVLWLDAAQIRRLRLNDGDDVWLNCNVGGPAWVRFQYVTAAFNRAAFEAVEVRPGHDPAQLPPGASWLPSEPRFPPAEPAPSRPTCQRTQSMSASESPAAKPHTQLDAEELQVAHDAAYMAGKAALTSGQLANMSPAAAGAAVADAVLAGWAAAVSRLSSDGAASAPGR